MRFRIVNDDIVTIHQGIDSRNHGLVAIIHQEPRLVPGVSRQFRLQLLVRIGIPRHHTGPHGPGQAVLCSCLGIGLPYFRVIGKAEVIVQAPNQVFATSETHSRADFTLQFGEHVIALRFFCVLPQGSGAFFEFMPKIHTVLNLENVR